jgi:hypothetical protein
MNDSISKVMLSPSVRVIKSPDGAALLDVREGTCLALNQTGSFIWDRLATGDSEDAIVEALARECDEPVENVRRGYSTFIQKLVDNHLAGPPEERVSQERTSILGRLFSKVFGRSLKNGD